ncbi:hypothetical protein CMI37_16155 [Candidatus Pacearchaeota archaeon]|nr:hypothetical protein [Candidatus Pacearchaeota archaeon]|tara:strand:+ start:565 stop:831 length:267 start_codon:yes stop_codon:yes gene_type:complete
MDTQTRQTFFVLLGGEEPNPKLIEMYEKVCEMLNKAGLSRNLPVPLLAVMAYLAEYDPIEDSCEHDWQQLENGTLLCFKCDAQRVADG